MNEESACPKQRSPGTAFDLIDEDAPLMAIEMDGLRTVVRSDHFLFRQALKKPTKTIRGLKYISQHWTRR
jgi:hypothetical protein